MAGALVSPSGGAGGPRMSLGGHAAQPGLASALLAAGNSSGVSPRGSTGGHAGGLGLAAAMLGSSSVGGGGGGGGSTGPSPRVSLAGHQPVGSAGGGGVLASLALGSECSPFGGVRPPPLSGLSLGSGGPSPRVSVSGLTPTPPSQPQPQPPAQAYSSVSMPSPRRRVSMNGGAAGSVGAAAGGGGGGGGGGQDPLLAENVGSPVLPFESAVGVPLPPGRPGLWAGIGASRWLRHLCLHQCVLGPEDVQVRSVWVRPGGMQRLEAPRLPIDAVWWPAPCSCELVPLDAIAELDGGAVAE